MECHAHAALARLECERAAADGAGLTIIDWCGGAIARALLAEDSAGSAVAVPGLEEVVVVGCREPSALPAGAAAWPSPCKKPDQLAALRKVRFAFVRTVGDS